MSDSEVFNDSGGGSYQPTPQKERKRPLSPTPLLSDDDMADGDEDGQEDDILVQLMHERNEEIAAELAALMARREATLAEIVEDVNVVRRQHGYPNLHKNQVRDDNAYYRCGCKVK